MLTGTSSDPAQFAKCGTRSGCRGLRAERLSIAFAPRHRDAGQGKAMGSLCNSHLTAAFPAQRISHPRTVYSHCWDQRAGTRLMFTPAPPASTPSLTYFQKKKNKPQKPTSKLMSIQFVRAESLLRQACAQRLLLERNAELRKAPQQPGRADEEEEHGNAGHRSCAPPGPAFANLGFFLANLLHRSTLPTDRIRRRSRRPHRSSLLLKS